MIIIGVDYLPSDQYIAFVDTETGKYGERQLNHTEGETEKFYRELARRGVRVPEWGWRPRLLGQDAAVFCLGAHTGAVSDADLRRITVDYTIEFARVLHASSPGAAFSFLSGSGADQSGRSRIPFALYTLPARVHLPGGAAKGT
jgi:hypothetical protein